MTRFLFFSRHVVNAKLALWPRILFNLYRIGFLLNNCTILNLLKTKHFLWTFGVQYSKNLRVITYIFAFWLTWFLIRLYISEKEIEYSR